ncbi:hypothetical protein C0V72_08270 [Porphyrobacter sp. TH134]|uniref:hypothetical protein n=1 Tax=Porphyrobacter sp. TH134 TaxID=2067450 RepID=UPI000C7CC5F9|nr:hypothetical protein [Porphyrobacter sp. TH134]PLK23737.1 hypothetical protein C0V72_08270 [Porphyrobacter sp. TH134]
MKKFAFAGLLLSAAIASPALSLEHEVVIDHEAGPIAADYKGSVTIDTKQVGTVGVAGRPSTLACQWTASLNVERVAKVGESLRSQRTLSSNDVASGTKPGWCKTNAKAIDALVDRRSDTFRAAMLALVEQDRGAILAEAESAQGRSRGV